MKTISWILLVAALGELRSCTESPGCAFEGVDRIYYYGGFYLSTSQMDGTQCIQCLWFADDTVATEAGGRSIWESVF